MSNDQDHAEIFGIWLDLTMENKGINGTDLAKYLNVHPSAVSKWRQHKGVPGINTCLRLAKVLKVDPIQLAVTAGLMDGRLIEIAPLMPPKPTAKRAAAKREISKIKYLTEQERRILLDTYDKIGEEGARDDTGGT